MISYDSSIFHVHNKFQLGTSIIYLCDTYVVPTDCVHNGYLVQVVGVEWLVHDGQHRWVLLGTGRPTSYSEHLKVTGQVLDTIVRTKLNKTADKMLLRSFWTHNWVFITNSYITIRSNTVVNLALISLTINIDT